jgi:hypothetical protein
MSTKKTNQTALNKCDELIQRLTELKKALTSVDSTQVQSNRKPVNGLAGWSSDPSTGALHHSTLGIINTFKHPDGYYQMKHGGRSVGRAADPAEAGAKIRNYINSLQSGDTGMQANFDPMSVSSQNFGKNEKKDLKKYSSEQLAAIAEAEHLKKNTQGKPWMNHSKVPNADAEVAKLQKTNPVNRAENLMPNQLAALMQGKAMLGPRPPKQPTDQEMFGHLVPSEEEIQKAESKWSNTMNWLEEAMKPISSRFDSPEEEQAYWDSIKVNGSKRDDFGF